MNSCTSRKYNWSESLNAFNMRSIYSKCPKSLSAKKVPLMIVWNGLWCIDSFVHGLSWPAVSRLKHFSLTEVVCIKSNDHFSEADTLHTNPAQKGAVRMQETWSGFISVLWMINYNIAAKLATTYDSDYLNLYAGKERHQVPVLRKAAGAF